MIEIEYLADVPYFLPVLVDWAWREWHRQEGEHASVLADYRERISRGRFPLALVAVDDGTPVGTISIKLDELPSRPDLFPWLGSLFVVPRYRKRGIGRKLVGRAESIARDGGVPALFLITEAMGALCEREGWYYIGDEPYREGRSVSVYGKDLRG
jgi:GNAT superfamily N-acetyltransferase